MITVLHLQISREEEHEEAARLLSFAAMIGQKNDFKSILDGKNPIAHYKEVAIVDTLDLDHAFRLTNSIEQPWVKNPGVQARNGTSHRSTSCGDLMIDHNGRTWYVASFGFEELV